MRISDILRNYADMLDATEYREEQGIDVSVDTTVKNVCEPDDLYVPPLQQKLEPLKKAVGVENMYDDGNDECYDSTSIDDLKKNAGIVITDEMSSDGSIES